jgi:alkanesulfonate monooxygenase SsuD/methylene tetrahydromethanopterin reductase-like flavin-dependent oxidoreductase (luciferase family)
MPLSVLDLCPIVSGFSCDAFARSLDLARHTESLGYRRFCAEHHTCRIASATSVVIGHLAQGTENWVGSGGIMLLNHSPS